MANRLRSYPPFKHHGIEALGRADQGDREVIMFAALHESESGTYRTSRDVRLESAKQANADIGQIAVSNRDFIP